MSFIKNLQINMNKVTEGYFANWTPEIPIAVGDYGDIKGYRFTRDGNISRYKLSLELDSARTKTATFEKKYGVTIKTSAKAKSAVDALKAKFDLTFGDEGSFLYHFTDITNIQFKERQVVFEKIGRLILSGKIKWRDDYVLIVEVKQAGKAFIIVADSANATMQIECKASSPIDFNLASAAGTIGYAKDSDRVIKYDVKETISPLFRVVAFSSLPPDGGPNNSISKAIEKVKSWFRDQLPEPETINLTNYVEKDDRVEGTFTFTNGQVIKLCQKSESIEDFIQNSEKKELELEQTAIAIAVVQTEERKMYG